MDGDAFKAAFAAAPDRDPVVGSPPIRATRKAEQWASAIHRAYCYLADRTREPGRQAELVALAPERQPRAASRCSFPDIRTGE
jgi:hypothetical protein